MVAERINSLILGQFPHVPTDDQQQLILDLSSFIFHRDARSLFIIKGYAGTGKTSIVAALVNAMAEMRIKTALLAPTGRAAKVLSGYSGKVALTIHKKIYRLRRNADGGSVMSLQENLHTNTIFIVDEASMIPGPSKQYSSSKVGFDLLNDLLTYVSEGRNCQLLFVGDTAQLPPVGQLLSPALDPDYFRQNYRYDLHVGMLKEVVRQELDSDILSNATSIRQHLASKEKGFPTIEISRGGDVVRLGGDELEDALNSAYDESGVEDTMVICRSNKRANLFNQQIRTRIRWQEDELAAGDFLMVVRNNYHWLTKDSKAGFIANGDIIEVLRVGKVWDLYGFRFMDVTMRLIDYPDEPDLEVKLLLDTISTETPALTQEDQRKLFYSVMEDYQDLPTKGERMSKMRIDPFYNALQVKFAYAVTCHKSQGGQWEQVFIDQGYLTDEMMNEDFLRWLYTAFTRATRKLYLVNFAKQFFGEEQPD